jgi:thymidylate kinase
MKFSINKKIINKNETNHWTQAKGFEPVDISPAEFAKQISLGYAFSFQFHGGHRKAENYFCSDIIAADIDDGMTLEEAMNDPFVVTNACLLYTTASHTPENHRFRLVFQLPQTVTDPDQMRTLLRGLVRKFPADRANTDPARQFYGSKGCSPHIFGNVLTEEGFTLLLGLGSEPINISDRQDSKAGKSGFRSTLTLDENTEVRDARGHWVKLADMPGSTPVFCPHHQDKHASAFTTISKSGIKGIHCSKCQMTFWSKGKSPEPFDFLVFDKLVRKEVDDFVPSTVADESGLFDHNTLDPNILVSERYLPKLPLQDGLTLIKSGKGTGKTHYLRQLVAEYKKKKMSVLLVGHRRSLLRALSESLGLQYYRDVKENAMFACHSISRHFAVSVDSMAKMLKPNINKFDVVLIDESEQVFSHLIADTIELEIQRKCYLMLQHFIHTAKAVVALDADLNHITLHAIQRFGNKNPFADRRLVLNEYKFPQKTVDLYVSENHLIGDITNSVKKGDRIFVCSNSKKRIDALVLSIKEECGDIPLFWLTATNSESPEATHFITNIKSEILKYQVVLVSPAMGTGIDITFPDEVSNIDGVYGLFYSRINTHFDIDQQLSRVRHPKFVRIWITPETFEFETEVDPIKQEIAESNIIPEVLTGYASTGLPDFNWNDPYLTLYATILSAQRASKNRLRKNFIDLKTYNGWRIEDIAKDDVTAAKGSWQAKLGEALREDAVIQRIMNAEVIDRFEVDDLKRKVDSGKTVTAAEKNSLDRYWIEKFYLQPVTTELIQKDNDGRFRKQIEVLEVVLGTRTKSDKPTDIHVKADLLRDLLQASGVLKADGKFDTSLMITNDGLKRFVAKCRKNRLKIERVLETTVRKDLAEKPMAQLTYLLGFCGIKTIKDKPFTVAGQKTYQYRLDDLDLNKTLTLIENRRLRYNTVE